MTVENVIVILGILGPLIVAILKHYGIKRHAEALQIVVNAVKKVDSRKVKAMVEEDSMDLTKIKAIIDRAVAKTKPPQESS